MAEASEREVLLWLKENSDRGTRDLNFLSQGYFSKAYSFSSPLGEFVIRVSRVSNGFEKDEYAFHAFKNLPIPAIESRGEMSPGVYYAISKRIIGIPSNKLNPVESVALIPSLIDAVNKIRCNSFPFSGCGPVKLWPVKGFPYESWKTFISDLDRWHIDFNARAGEVFMDWQSLLKKSFVDRKLVAQLRKRLMELVGYCPEERSLVHGDFGFDNVLTCENEVTGVIDWAEMKCGDFIFDIAALDFYADHAIDYGQAFREYYDENDVQVPRFEQRLECYKTYHALACIFFQANRGEEENYRKDMDRFQKLI
jgi:hygromycin-B 4-O-kinase